MSSISTLLTFNDDALRNPTSDRPDDRGFISRFNDVPIIDRDYTRVFWSNETHVLREYFCDTRNNSDAYTASDSSDNGTRLHNFPPT